MLNRRDFKLDLIFSREDTFIISAGKLFYKVEIVTLNGHLAYDLTRDTITSDSIWLADLSFRDDFLIDASSHRYSRITSVVSLIDLKVVRKI